LDNFSTILKDLSEYWKIKAPSKNSSESISFVPSKNIFELISLLEREGIGFSFDKLSKKQKNELKKITRKGQGNSFFYNN